MDFDKKLKRLKKSKAYWQSKVDEDKRRKSKSAYKAMKIKEKEDAEELANRNKSKEVIRVLDRKIEETKEGSQEEKDLLLRRNRLIKALL